MVYISRLPCVFENKPLTGHRENDGNKLESSECQAIKIFWEQ